MTSSCSEMAHILPNEVLLNVLYHLDGDKQTIHSLVQTCRLFRVLLRKNEARIAYNIGHKYNPGPIRFLLEGTAPKGKSPSFQWLHRGYARGHAIELLVNALENAGLYCDRTVFGTDFSLHGRPLVPADHTDIRRYVMTMLLAVELCSISGRTEVEKRIWIQNAPLWAAGFVLLSRDLMRFLVKVLQLCIQDSNTVLMGTTEAPAAWLYSERCGEYLTDFLYHGVLLSGSRGIIDILSTTYDTFHQFEAISRYRLYADYVESDVLEQLWPNGPTATRWQLFRRIQAKNSEDWRKASSSNSPDIEFKDYVFHNDIDEWKRDVPSQEAWAHFMHKNDWSRVLSIDGTFLRMRETRPVLPLIIGGRATTTSSIGSDLRDRVLAY